MKNDEKPKPYETPGEAKNGLFWENSLSTGFSKMA